MIWYYTLYIYFNGLIVLILGLRCFFSVKFRALLLMRIFWLACVPCMPMFLCASDTLSYMSNMCYNLYLYFTSFLSNYVLYVICIFYIISHLLYCRRTHAIFQETHMPRTDRNFPRRCFPSNGHFINRSRWWLLSTAHDKRHQTKSKQNLESHRFFDEQKIVLNNFYRFFLEKKEQIF